MYKLSIKYLDQEYSESYDDEKLNWWYFGGRIENRACFAANLVDDNIHIMNVLWREFNKYKSCLLFGRDFDEKKVKVEWYKI